MKTLLLLCISLFSFTSQLTAQLSVPLLDSLCDEIEATIGEDWFIIREKHGFKVYFCRSCQNAYDSFLAKQSWPRDIPFKPREDFFDLKNMDSVSYYPTVSSYGSIDMRSDSLYHASKRKFYKADDVLMFKVSFEPKWTAEKYQSVYEKNELLKAEILKEPLFKSNDGIFSDYRFWLPSDFWKKRTKKYTFYFKRLPYISKTLDYSIFIVPDKPYYFTKPMYVDKTDAEYYENPKNKLEAERKRALKIIALTLGIHDYRFVN